MIGIKLRQEIISARDEAELVRNINPVISWDDFTPPEGPDRPAKLGGVEGNPEWFFKHTYPTSVIREILNGLKDKSRGTAAGVFPLDGYLGSGKSHVLLTIYHIFRHPEKASEWLRRWDMEFPLLDQSIVIPMPLQSKSYKDLWTPIFKALGKEIDVEEEDWPKGKQLKRAVGDKRVAILIDEIDNWYDARKDQEKARIRGFFQSLSEASEDPNYQINLVMTFLGISQDVKLLRNIIARPRGGSAIIMQRTEDIFDIVRFRLFEEIDESKVEDITIEYLKKIESELKKTNLGLNSHLKDELKRAYPFHPSFLRTLSSLKVRQMLVMLARIVKRKIDKSDLIICSDVDDDILREYLHSVNEKIIDAYFEDLEFVDGAKEVREHVISYELGRGVLLTSLLNTLETGKGADIHDIIFGCTTKYTIQDIHETISFLEKWTRLKKVNEDGLVRYVITTELPPAVKIERQAEFISATEATKIVQEHVKTIVSTELRRFKLLHDPAEVQNDRRFKILVLLEKPLDIPSVYPEGFTYKNTLYLLYPGYTLKSEETLKLAKRIIASKELTETETQPKTFKEFHRDYLRHLKRQIDNAGWRVHHWSRKHLKDKPVSVEKSLPTVKDVESVVKENSSNEILKYFLNMIINEQGEISVRELKERFYRLEGAPILLKEENLLKLLAEMEKGSEIAIKTRQGRTLFKQTIFPQSIGNDDIVKKPPKDAVPPTVNEIMTMVKDKKELPFKECKERYPFVGEDVLEKVYTSSMSEKEGVYLLEENRILDRPRNTKLSTLVVREEAARVVEPLVVKLVREKIAIRVVDLLMVLKETYVNSGLTEDIIIMIGDNLEIGGQISIIRKKDGIIFQLPGEELLEELKKKLFFEVRKCQEARKDDLFDRILNEVPTEIRSLEDALAILIDDGKFKCDKDKLSLPKRPPKPPLKRVIIRHEGEGKEILKLITNDVEDSEVIERVKIEILDNMLAKSLKELIAKISNQRMRIMGRRKET